MRTTPNIADDVLEQARRVSGKLHTPFRQVVNEALRAGLPLLEATSGRKPFRTVPRAMGLKPGYNVDNVQELLAHIEGEDAR